jgi:dTDP-4-amino-4,6-dideoxygalactose transaminase
MIPFLDLKGQYNQIKDEIEPAVFRVLNSGLFILGKEVEQFEKEFSNYIGSKHCITVASGTDAIMISLKAYGIKRGDEVITVANTASPTVMGILNAGATPVIVDCDGYYNIDAEKIEEKITSKTKAIIPVHLYGQPADMNIITEIAQKYSLSVIEDSCQSHGSEYNGKKTGSFGTGCFSFYPTKNLGCYGDGGAITTNDDKINEICRTLRFYGQKKTIYNSAIQGYNSRLDEIQATILRVKLKYLDKWNKMRQENARIYNDLLKEFEVPKIKENRSHVYHIYAVKTKRRDKLRLFLDKNGIGTGIHYPYPINKQKAFGIRGSFPEAEKNSKKIISLPMFPELKEEDIKGVCKKMQEFF